MEKQEQEERKHIEALDRKIERLQEKVIKKHKEYSVLAEELSTLLDERHPERKIERVKNLLKTMMGIYGLALLWVYRNMI